MTDTLRKVFIKTYGCQMNAYDSARMADTLAGEGFETTENADLADLILLNTCHIREKAADKVYSDIGRLRRLKNERASVGNPLLIGVAGCVAQAEGTEMMRRAPAIDFLVGPQNYHHLPQLLAQAKAGKRPVDVDFAVDDKFSALPSPSPKAIAARGPAAFLTVQEGCDKFCSFCVVPYTRGAEMSRPVSRIIAEAQRLASAGVREITLLGQNVNAYHGAGADGRPASLGRLLFALARQVPQIARLRYTTSHPRDMHDELYEAHRDLPQLMPYLHLPVQSGSDRMLHAMNRGHTRGDYLRLIERMRQVRPDIAFSSDIIVGHPGESEADFDDTLSLVEEVGYAACYSFKYSERPGTPAAAHDDQITEAIKSERLARLQERLDAHASAFTASLVGMILPVLLERQDQRTNRLIGRSPFLIPVNVDAPSDLLGHIVAVHIRKAAPYHLSGDVAANATDILSPASHAMAQ